MYPTQAHRFITIIFLVLGLLPALCQDAGYIERFEKNLSTSPDGEGKAEILFALITHYTANDMKKAQAFSEELIQLGQKLNNPAIVARGFSEKANLLRRDSQLDSARHLLWQAKMLTLKTQNESVKGLIDLRLGLLFSDERNHDSSAFYFASAAAHYGHAHDDCFLALALASQGALFQKLERMDTAKLFFDNALKTIAGVLKTDSSYWPTRHAAVIANYQGIYHTLIGKYEEALQWNLQSLRLIEKTGDIRFQAAALHATGTTYRKLLKYTKANEQFRKALIKFRLVNDRPGLEACYESMAMAFDDMHSIDSAVVYFNGALKVAQALENTAMQGNIFNNIGAMYHAAKDYQKAIGFYEKAFAIRGGFEKSNKRDFAAAMINLGQVSVKTGDMNKASDYLNRGLRASRELHSPDYEKSALEGLIEYHNAARNFQKAFAYQDSLMLLKDSLYLAESKSKVAEMEVRYETEKKEQEIALLKIENRYAHLRQMAWMAGAAISIIIAGLIAYTLQNRKARIKAQLAFMQKEKEVVEGQLLYKDRELVNFATYITEKNDFLETVLERMNTIKIGHEEGQKQVEKLVPLIRDNINISGSRDEFNASLDHVYHSFIKKLEDKHPDLTDYEKRLAMLLRVNLSSKQIASVLGISSKSVDMSRYRLRKKMGLQQDEELHDILNRI